MTGTEAGRSDGQDAWDEVEVLHARSKERREEELAAARTVLGDLRRRGPQTIEDAILRFRRHRRHDPFPEIASGLLTCAAFCAYIAEAGVVFPFDATTETVELASIDLPLLGKAVWWDEKRQRQELEIRKDTPFVLKKNSIAFVTLRPYLQLPDYIALRFNLRVRHVYRGLLLGTGPLVDPGYQGYLAIPLHNLTNNEYTFHGGEGLVAVEFTKLDLGLNTRRGGEKQSQSGTSASPTTNFFVPFREPQLARPDPEQEHPITVNLAKARVAQVESSLPAFDAAIRSLERKVESRTKWLSIGGALALIALVVTIASVVWQATSEVRSIGDREERIIGRFEAGQKAMVDSLAFLRDRLKTLEARVCGQIGANGSQRTLPTPQTPSRCP